LERVIEAFGQVFDRIVDLVPFGAVTVRHRNGDFAGEVVGNPVELARAVAAEALFRRTPELFEVVDNDFWGSRSVVLHVRARRGSDLDIAFRQSGDDAVVDDAVLAAAAIISGPLRDAAARIRAGELSPDLAAPPAPEPVEPAPLPNTHVVFLRSVKWLDRHGLLQQRLTGGYEVPQPVADAALRLGVGVLAESAAGKAALARIHAEGFVSRPALGLRPEPTKYADLGSLEVGAVA
jgi:hypothetical protein